MSNRIKLFGAFQTYQDGYIAWKGAESLISELVIIDFNKFLFFLYLNLKVKKILLKKKASSYLETTGVGGINFIFFPS
jgi:hypothetical protein